MNSSRARIYRSSQRNFECRLVETGEKVEAVALGNLLKGGEVVVGDFVSLMKGSGGEWQIVEVLPRKNEIYRMIIRENIKKITASNIDLLVIVVSVSFPLYKRGLVDRYLIRAAQWGISPVLVFNKIDEKSRIDLSFEIDRLKDVGVRSFALSALVPLDFPGYGELKEFLKGKTALFQGQSGVGKSKLITSLTDGKVQLKGQNLGKVRKGVHTTTWVELVDCQDFEFIDSPGIRSFSLEDIKKEDLIQYFPDIHELSVRCQFPNCQHQKNSKGCSFFREENFQGARNQELLLSRLESFHQIYEEVSAIPSWEKD